ncbi:MAG: phosphate propanoyltransferase [Elusimicrobia bacterium]|nr:phosphate propanoyltransferase [Elusimicrobiota bacterium]
MDRSKALAQKIAEKIMERAQRSQRPIPVGISNRHVHLSQKHFEDLFGKGTQPRKLKSVVQPGYYACYETVTLAGPKGKISDVRLIAPARPKTQVEISKTDAMVLGIKPPVRDSGKLEGSSPVRLVGPAGEVDIAEGCILAKRHIHFAPEEAKEFGIQNGESVRVRAGTGGDRETVFEQVLCRVSGEFKLEFHLDTDEANACMVKNGDLVHIV